MSTENIEIPKAECTKKKCWFFKPWHIMLLFGILIVVVIPISIVLSKKTEIGTLNTSFPSESEHYKHILEGFLIIQTKKSLSFWRIFFFNLVKNRKMKIFI